MTRRIPFLDASAGYAELAAELDQAALRVLRSGHYVLGPETAGFEREFAAYCGIEHCVGVASGLDALVLALRAAGVGDGDEVVVPANTFIATWLAVSAVGATPVPVDPDPATWNLTAAGVAGALTPRTRAVVVVHLYGRLAPMRDLRALCDERDLLLVEDAAQAHGAEGPHGRAGALGHVAAFSFYPTKNLGAFGDGGAVTTADPALAERVALLRNYGARRKYENEERGVNSRLDPLQAALLRVKLQHLDAWNARRRALARRYSERLAGAPGVTLPAPAGADHVWHLFTVLVEDRDRVAAALARDGIETLVHYPIPPHLAPAYRDHGFAAGDFPVAEHLAERLLSLPLGPQLPSPAVDRVASALATASSAPAAARAQHAGAR